MGSPPGPGPGPGRPGGPGGAGRGLRVRLDPSVALLALLVGWLLWLVFAGTWGDGRAVAMAVSGSVLFVASILAHETAHAVEARRRGLEVGGITLYVFGGVTRLRSEPQRWSDELALTVVGPATSLALCGAFVGVAFWSDAAGVGPVRDVAVQLAWFNGMLGLFNLLPGAPLDGGRIVDALLWRRTGDRYRSAVSAARAGQWLGTGLVVVGIATMVLLVGGLVSGLWLAVIGWFLRSSATAELEVGRLRQVLRGRRVGQVVPPVGVVGPGSSVEGAMAAGWAAGRTDLVAVVGGDVLVGVVEGSALETVPPGERPWRVVEGLLRPAATLPAADQAEPADVLVPRLADGPVAVYDGSRFVTVATVQQLTATGRWLGSATR